MFLDNIEKELFNPNNIRKTQNNLKKEDKLALNEMKSWDDKVIQVQDKGSRFVIPNTSNYVDKVVQQINRSSYHKINSEPSSKFKNKVIDWVEKWCDKKN